MKNCSNVTDVKLYKNFVAYRNNDSILVSNIFEIRSTTEPHPISSPLSVNDIKMFEDGFNKVLDKFNFEKTFTVDILVLCAVSALIFVYIMIFTVNNVETLLISDQHSRSAPIRDESSLQESSGAGQRKLAHSTALHITDESMMYTSTHGISIINENITNPLVITRCPHVNCPFIKQKGKKGLKIHLRMKHP